MSFHVVSGSYDCSKGLARTGDLTPGPSKLCSEALGDDPTVSLGQ